MTDLELQMVLKFVDKATKPARRAMKAIEAAAGPGVMKQARLAARGSTLMASGMLNVAKMGAKGAAAVGAYAGTMSALAVALADPAREFERFQTILKTTEGSSEAAREAMAWVETFATKTPYELDQVMAAFVQLRAYGLDPTNGLLADLGDASAAMGKDVMQAVEAVADAVTGENERLKEFGIKASKVGEHFEYAYTVDGEARVIKAMADDRAAIEAALREVFSSRFSGAMGDLSQTFDGMLSNVLDYVQKFKRMVMAAGVFDFMKDELRALLDMLDAMAADGRLEALASSIGTHMMAMMTWTKQAAVAAYEGWQWLYPILEKTADLLGGWDKLAFVAAAMLMAKQAFFLTFALGKVAWGAVMVGRVLTTGLFAVLGRGAALMLRFGAFAATVAKGGMVLLAKSIKTVARAVMWAGRVLLTNPIFLALAAIAGLAYVIYQNWDGFVAYFAEKIDRVKAAFEGGLLNGVLRTLAEFNPFLLIMDGAINLINYLTGWNLNSVTEMLTSAFDIDLLQAGINMITSLKTGIWSILVDMVAGVSAKLASIVPPWLMKAWNWVSGGGGDAPAEASPDGKRATGGPVRAGFAYMINENGQEMFSPNVDGRVISARDTARMGGGSGGSFNVGGITINAGAGQSPQEIAKLVMRELDRKARAAGYALNDGGSYA